jgi:hypothetical protein
VTYDDNATIRVELKVIVDDEEFVTHGITDAWPMPGEPVEERIRSTVSTLAKQVRREFSKEAGSMDPE